MVYLVAVLLLAVLPRLVVRAVMPSWLPRDRPARTRASLLVAMVRVLFPLPSVLLACLCVYAADFTAKVA